MSHRKKWLAALLWNTSVFILVYLFLGETALFYSEHSTSAPILSLVDLLCLFAVRVAVCCRGGRFMAERDHNTPAQGRSGCELW